MALFSFTPLSSLTDSPLCYTEGLFFLYYLTIPLELEKHQGVFPIPLELEKHQGVFPIPLELERESKILFPIIFLYCFFMAIIA